MLKQTNNKVPSTPKLLGVDGDIFSEEIDIHLKSEDKVSGYSISGKRISKLSGTPCCDEDFSFNDISEDFVLDIRHFKDGEYEAVVRSYTGKDENKTYSKPLTIRFAVANKEKILKCIGFSDGRRVLSDKGIFGTIAEGSKAKRGVLLTFDDFKNKDTFCKGYVKIKGKKHPIKYFENEEALKGLCFIPYEKSFLRNLKNVEVFQEEFADKNMIVSLDEKNYSSDLFSLNPLFVDFEDNSLFIEQTIQGKSKFYPNQNVDIYFGNVNWGDNATAYEVLKNGKPIDNGVQRADSESVRICLDSVGKYEIKAYVLNEDDEVLLEKKQNYIVSKENKNASVKIPEEVRRGGFLKVEEEAQDVKNMELMLNKYTGWIPSIVKGKKHMFNIKIDNKIPEGKHVLLLRRDGKVSSSSIIIKSPLSENQKKEIIKNTSFVFSGHNIKFFAALAMETFAKECNIEKSQMFFFDDLSSDGSGEELKERGFNVITWDEKTLKEFNESSYKENLPIRVEEINQSIIKQMKSKYVMFLDGDTYYKGDILSSILDEVEVDRSGNFTAFGLVRNTGDEKTPLIKEQAWGVWQNFFWFNREVLEKENLLLADVQTIDKIKESFKIDFERYYDTGNAVYYNLINNKLKNITLTSKKEWEADHEKLFVHLGWLSSSMRNDICFAGDWDEHKNRILDYISTAEFKKLLKDHNIDTESLKNEFEANFKRS